MSDFLGRVGQLGRDLWDWIGGTNPDAWAAGAGWTTAAIALVASIAAFRQVREARTLREEQAQPYVVAFMEASQTSQHIVELVVKNFGTTVARNVQMDCQPPLKRTSSGKDATEEVRVFESLPVLVPGQEWRIFWDSGVSRKDANLPDRYEVTLRYQDSHDKNMPPTQAILDWGFYKSRMWVETFGTHHAAKALRELSSSVKQWTESDGGLSVFVRDGEIEDERRRARNAEMYARLEALNALQVEGGGDDVEDALSAPANEDAVAEGSPDSEGPTERPTGNGDVTGDRVQPA
ncbi:hypothetical protein FB565_004544 [Actinoplanes lutulentus]|nr:hypothetical protein [Actinoplanes lutulentus]MBB2944811.1 hypothetical protein [Actinoplanes lutulentus]